MTMQPQEDALDDSRLEKQIATHLRKNPTFFERHPALLTELVITHGSGQAISLIERQVTVLREQNQKLKQHLRELIQIARDNDKLNNNIHRLTVSLMEADSLKAIVTVIENTFRNQFNTDAVCTRFFVESPLLPSDTPIELIEANVANRKMFDSILAKGKPCCGKLKAEQLNYLFGSTNIGSAAILPLGDARTGLSQAFGVVAIGSENPHRFKPTMDTLFLTHIAKVIATVIRPYIAAAT